MMTKKSINKTERPLYILIVAAFVVYMVQRIFFPVTLLNEPLKLIYIPVLVLIVVSMYITRHRFWLLGQSATDPLNIRVWVLGINTFKYFVAFGIVYVFSFLVAFKTYVRYIGPLGQTELYSIPVTKVHQGTSKSAPSVGFYFKERYNTLNASAFREVVKDATTGADISHEVSIECRKSVFSCYLVDEYTIR